MSRTHGTIGWTELMTRDVPTARDFYGRICGWSFDTMAMAGGEYTVAMAHGSPVAGLMSIEGMPDYDDREAHWFTYVTVDNVDAAAAAVEQAGGTLDRAPYDVPGVGRIVLVRDPTGAAIGMMTPENVMEGDEGEDSDLENLPV